MSSESNCGEIQTHDYRTLKDVVAAYVPTEYFRISRFEYPPGAAFAGRALAGRVYVLSGSCAFTFHKTQLSLNAGKSANLPAGTYEFRTVGDTSVDLVRVWALSQPTSTEGGL